MYGAQRQKAPTQPASQAPPKDALSALMEGETPDREALKFPTERQAGQDPGPGWGVSSGRADNHYGSNTHEYKSRPLQAEHSAPQQNNAFNSVKSAATTSGTFVKDKTVAGATYLKEKDWSREKELAGKAGTATKTGAVYVGSGVAKGASWLWKSGKSGVDNIRGKPTQ